MVRHWNIDDLMGNGRNKRYSWIKMNIRSMCVVWLKRIRLVFLRNEKGIYWRVDSVDTVDNIIGAYMEALKAVEV